MLQEELLKIVRIALFLLISINCFSQDLLSVPVNHRSAFANNSRDTSGLPGRKYWQNSGDYLIKISFDPSSRLLDGNVTIEYTNNSPDTLKKILFKLYPNLYQEGAVRTMAISPKDLSEGVSIKSLSVKGEVIDPKRLVTRGTNMSLRDCMILPGATVHVAIDYSYILNEGSFIRTGQIDSGSFFIAYFFPRIAVYDDIDGWNEYPYTGREEFYNDFGDFRCEITVPGEYQVWSTGDLVNAEQVLNKKFIDRIDSASRYDGVIEVISESDLRKKNICQSKEKNTWVFQADQVTDVAFALSNHFIWKSTSIVVDSISMRRTRVDAVYNPTHKMFDPVLDYSRRTVGEISHRFPKFPFPFPHITIVEGLDAMEYPMMVNCFPWDDNKLMIELTVHEIFHTLFPFYVGMNESKYSFMDEGLATLTEFTLYNSIVPSATLDYDISAVNQTAGTDYDVPIVTVTPQLIGKARFSNKDLKPALGFYYVMEMLGEEKFSKGLRYFIQQWKGKHPMPYDFFNCINNGAGVNLNWFWNDWFYNKVAPDLAIGKVIRQKSRYVVEVRKIGAGSVPVHMEILYSDGSREQLTSDISCWSKGNDSVAYKIKSKKVIQQIRVGNDFDVDIDKSNNTWKKQ